MHHLLVLHGPNLNLLGSREPEVYGNATLEQLNTKLKEEADLHAMHLTCKQSNSEDDLVLWIQNAPKNKIDGIIINAAAYTHTSIAIRDSLLAVAIPFIEVHISNIYSRESFRKNSVLADKAVGVITGFGLMSYSLAISVFASYPHAHPVS